MIATQQNFIDGQWRASRTGETFPNVNPANREEVLGHFQSSGAEDMVEAIEAAALAFEGWRKVPAPGRAAVAARVLDAMRAEAEQFARAITLENGKTLREGRAEVAAAVSELDFQIGQAARLGGVTVPSRTEGVLAYLRRDPLGVVSVITPWNFPLNVACRKMFPALIAGNTVVLKPATFTPLTAVLLMGLLEAAELPPGVANLVTGTGAKVGAPLSEHPAVRGLTFTGSTEVGKALYARASASGIKAQVEMGGKNAAVVLGDADLELAARDVVFGAFSCAGQWCTSTSRAIVERSVLEEFTAMVVKRAEAMKVGNGLDEGVDMGPVAGRSQHEKILGHIEQGKREGARLLAGGQACTEPPLDKGYFVQPTVFDRVRPQMSIAREEIFGPVLCIIEAEDFEHALTLSNDSAYGLASSIYTNSLDKAQRFVEESRVGLCHVNMSTAYKEPQLPFGGRKDSGAGPPEAGDEGVEFFTEHKAVYVRHV